VGEVKSPCIGVCTLDDRTGLCRGCLRTAKEVADWLYLDDAGKREIWELLATRRAKENESEI